MNIHKQQVFTEEMLNDFYLSPYVDLELTEDGCWLGRREKEDKYILNGNPAKIKALFEKLSDGVSNEELIYLLHGTFYGMDENGNEISPEEWKEFFMWEGIIE